MLSKILAPLIYLFAWLLFHGRKLLESAAVGLSRVLKLRIALSLHTFIGAILAVFYYYLFTGRVPHFHGFYDAMPLIAEYARAARGVGATLMMAVASVLLILFGEGIVRLLGYWLIFLVWLILSAFETPRAILSLAQV